jgi:hypothetical protein
LGRGWNDQLSRTPGEKAGCGVDFNLFTNVIQVFERKCAQAISRDFAVLAEGSTDLAEKAPLERCQIKEHSTGNASYSLVSISSLL